MYHATVPHILEAGHRVQIRGTLMEDAKEFSINFVNEPTNTHQNITYHFKCDLEQQMIVQNYKVNGDWINHTEIEANVFDGKEFAFEFVLQEETLFVYAIMQDNGYNLSCQFDLNNELAEIQKIEVWGDVSKVTQLSFIYP